MLTCIQLLTGPIILRPCDGGSKCTSRSPRPQPTKQGKHKWNRDMCKNKLYKSRPGTVFTYAVQVLLKKQMVILYTKDTLYYIYTYIYMYIYIYIYIYIYTNIYVYLYMYMKRDNGNYPYIDICICTCVYMYTYIHM